MESRPASFLLFAAFRAARGPPSPLPAFPASKVCSRPAESPEGLPQKSETESSTSAAPASSSSAPSLRAATVAICTVWGALAESPTSLRGTAAAAGSVAGICIGPAEESAMGSFRAGEADAGEAAGISAPDAVLAFRLSGSSRGVGSFSSASCSTWADAAADGLCGCAAAACGGGSTAAATSAAAAAGVAARTRGVSAIARGAGPVMECAVKSNRADALATGLSEWLPQASALCRAQRGRKRKARW